MSAEVLREAARLMRQRADLATPGVWTHAGWGDVVTGYQRPDDDDPLSSYYSEGSVAGAEDSDDADHIASWPPAVALAVADCLDAAARIWPPDPHEPREGCPDCSWLAVACAYLGVSA